MRPNTARFSRWICALVVVVLIPVCLLAQKAKDSRSEAEGPSKWDLFVGWSYLQPWATIRGQSGSGSTYGDILGGQDISFARYLTPNFGLQVEGSRHIQHETFPLGVNNSIFNSNDDFAGISGGAVYRLPKGRFTPFVHAQVGREKAGSVFHVDNWGSVVTLGGGVDMDTPLLNHHLAVRLAQVDYQMIHADNTSIPAARISVGVVLHTGHVNSSPSAELSCNASNSLIYPGDPMVVTAFEPERWHNTSYSWTINGVTLPGTNRIAGVETERLAPGLYTVRGHVRQGRKFGEHAQCSAQFEVRPIEPPTIACSITPSRLQPGEVAEIHATAISPQNRPLTYTYSASAGTVHGYGSRVTWDPGGAPVGAVDLSCNVNDDKGHSASTSTHLTVLQPSAPPEPKTEALCSASFSRDKKRPTRVDNEAKACLDDVALSLQKAPDAKVVVVGEASPKEKAALRGKKADNKGRLSHLGKPAPVIAGPDPAAQRAVNTKNYLVTEKGIDPSRIVVTTKAAPGQKVENILVPEGASVSSNAAGAQVVNEDSLHAEVRKPLPTRTVAHAAHGKKHAATKRVSHTEAHADAEVQTAPESEKKERPTTHRRTHSSAKAPHSAKGHRTRKGAHHPATHRAAK